VALDITERKRAEEAQQRAHDDLERGVRERTAALSKATADAGFMAEASRLLASSLNYETTLTRITCLAVPRLADWCAVDLLEEGESPRMVAAAHADRAKEALAWEIRRRYRPRPNDSVPRALRTGRSQIVAVVSDTLLAKRAQDADHLRLLQELGMRSYMIVPLVAHGRTLGAIVFVTGESGRRYGPPDLVLAKDLARRAALAVDNARLYRASQEAERRKDEFLSMLAHELRNPLAPILNATQVLEKIGSADPQAQEMRAIIRRQAYHLARLVDDLLDVARLQSGRILLRRESVDLRDVATRCLETLRAAGKATGGEVSLSLGTESLVVEGDPVRLDRVIGNLLDNAVKYSPPGGPISVAVERAGSEGVVRVRDRGQGIAPERLPHIFEPFSQAPKSLDRSNGGLGLGLSVVRRLVEMHGGKVMAQSPGPGQGSEFVVRLPLARRGLAPAQSDGAPNPPAPRHILLIEDQRDSREALRALLERAGHRVAVAADGRQGIELALALQPEVALIDLGLPVVNGYEVAQKLRGSPEGQRICLVALTGYGQPQDRQRVLAAGFDAHLLKPVDPGELWQAIAGLPRRLPE
jgi:signal transduction histidine kinase